jgi:hypothetical protein
MSEKKMISVPMTLNRDLLRKDVRTVMTHLNLTTREVDVLMGVQVVGNLLSDSHDDYMPTLRNYINLCNQLDLDPRRYFEFADWR